MQKSRAGNHSILQERLDGAIRMRAYEEAQAQPDAIQLRKKPEAHERARATQIPIVAGGVNGDHGR